MLKIVLLKSVSGLGKIGDVLPVKPGYAKNFLIPTGRAMIASEDVLKKVEDRLSTLKAAEGHVRAVAEKLASNAVDITVHLMKNSFQDGRLYGSVSTSDIAKNLLSILKNLPISIDKDVSSALVGFTNSSNIRLSSQIKYTGEYDASLVLYQDIMISFKILVTSEDV